MRDRDCPKSYGLETKVMRLLAVLLVGIFVGHSADACLIYRISILLSDPAAQMNEHDFTFRGRIIAVDQDVMTTAEYESWVEQAGKEHAEIRRIMTEMKSALAFKVDKVWKGQVSESFIAFYTKAPCTTSPTPGERYIVFGNVDQNGENHAWGFIPERGFEEVEYKLDRGY